MIVKKIFKRLFSFAYFIFIRPFKKMPKVLSCEETIDYILKNKASLSRFGDGELNLMQGFDINFQKAEKRLSEKLIEVKTNNKLLVAIPSIFEKEQFNKNRIVLNEYKFWRKNKLFNYNYWHKYFKDNLVLGDAFISRFYMRYNNKENVGEYCKKLKTLWKGQNVIVVEGKNSQIGVGNDILNNVKSIKRILCPSKNAFSKYEEILSEVQNVAKKDDLILLAVGPTATVLASDLSKLGYWALDLGHFDIEYEWFLAKTDKKIPIKSKHVNECGSNGSFMQEDKTYQKEIVKIIE